jgi:hypothetical protein
LSEIPEGEVANDNQQRRKYSQHVNPDNVFGLRVLIAWKLGCALQLTPQLDLPPPSPEISHFT